MEKQYIFNGNVIGGCHDIQLEVKRKKNTVLVIGCKSVFGRMFCDFLSKTGHFVIICFDDFSRENKDEPHPRGDNIFHYDAVLSQYEETIPRCDYLVNLSARFPFHFEKVLLDSTIGLATVTRQAVNQSFRRIIHVTVPHDCEIVDAFTENLAFSEKLFHEILGSYQRGIVLQMPNVYGFKDVDVMRLKTNNKSYLETQSQQYSFIHYEDAFRAILNAFYVDTKKGKQTLRVYAHEMNKDIWNNVIYARGLDQIEKQIVLMGERYNSIQDQNELRLQTGWNKLHTDTECVDIVFGRSAKHC